MARLTILTFVVRLVLSKATVAQEAPEMAAELKKLDQFVGNWTWEGEMKPGPMLPGSDFTGKETCEWFEGGFALICRSEGQESAGPTRGLAELLLTDVHTSTLSLSAAVVRITGRAPLGPTGCHWGFTASAFHEMT
jgi:hypothetical protein